MTPCSIREYEKIKYTIKQVALDRFKNGKLEGFSSMYNITEESRVHVIVVLHNYKYYGYPINQQGNRIGTRLTRIVSIGAYLKGRMIGTLLPVRRSWKVETVIQKT